MLTIAVNQPTGTAATEATVFGPFFLEGSPEVGLGGDIAAGASGRPCWFEGVVRDLDGRPVAGARVDVWEADEAGLYDVQYGDDRVAARGHLFTDAAGRYAFWGVTPTPYPIPHDGPVGDLLEAAGRGPMRPAHLHLMVTAAGFRRLVTHVFVRGDPHQDSDAVFGVKESLVVDFVEQTSGTAGPDGREVGRDWSSARFDVVLQPEPTGVGQDGAGLLREQLGVARQRDARAPDVHAEHGARGHGVPAGERLEQQPVLGGDDPGPLALGQLDERPPVVLGGVPQPLDHRGQLGRGVPAVGQPVELAVQHQELLDVVVRLDRRPGRRASCRGPRR